MLGAAEDGSVNVFIVARAIFHRPPRFPWATREGRAREGRAFKDAAQDVTQDMTQDVAEDVSCAAEGGSVKVFIVARVIFHRPQRFPWATREG